MARRSPRSEEPGRWWQRLIRKIEPHPEEAEPESIERSDPVGEQVAANERRAAELDREIEAKEGLLEGLKDLRVTVEAPQLENRLDTLQEQITMLTDETRRAREKQEERAQAELALERERTELLERRRP